MKFNNIVALCLSIVFTTSLYAQEIQTGSEQKLSPAQKTDIGYNGCSSKSNLYNSTYVVSKSASSTNVVADDTEDEFTFVKQLIKNNINTNRIIGIILFITICISLLLF